MKAPQKRPAGPVSADEPDGEHTIDDRPAAKLDDLLPTVLNNPAANKSDRAGGELLAPPAGDDEIGRLGTFRVLKLLGSGGMGIVFLAEDVALGRRVALKVMKPRADDGALAGQRFLKEARAIAQIKHDNLVTIFQVGQEGNTFFYAMELLAGETLENRIKQVKRWPLADILRIGEELASGLAAMHEHGLIHRDIKPANIWLEQKDEGGRTKDEKYRISSFKLPPSSFRVKILDFGLVRNVKDDIALTETGVVLGTPAFMSPEQIRTKKVDARTDLYSFGCILYRLCTGKYPHSADNTMAQLAAVVADEPDDVTALNPEIPPALARLVMQLLAKNPDDRPQKAAIVAQRLRTLQQTLATPGLAQESSDEYSSIGLSDDIAELRRPNSFLRRHWPKLLAAGAVLAGLGMLGLIGIIVAFFALGRDPGKKGPPPPHANAEKPDRQFLRDMKPVQTSSWPFFGKKDKDKDKGKKGPPKDLMNEPVSVKGELSPHGIFMHAAPPFEPPASISYQIDKKFRTFAAKVSLSDTSKGSNSPLIFTVFGDGVQLWQSNPVRDQADTQGVNVDVRNVTILKLQTTTQGEDVGGAHGAWIEPRLLR